MEDELSKDTSSGWARNDRLYAKLYRGERGLKVKEYFWKNVHLSLLLINDYAVISPCLSSSYYCLQLREQ